MLKLLIFLDFKHVATFTMSLKGHFKLLHGGFEFTKERTNKEGTTINWVCSKKRRYGCKGKARTRRIDSKEMVKIFGRHNHPPNERDF